MPSTIYGPKAQVNEQVAALQQALNTTKECFERMDITSDHQAKIEQVNAYTAALDNYLGLAMDLGVAGNREITELLFSHGEKINKFLDD